MTMTMTGGCSGTSLRGTGAQLAPVPATDPKQLHPAGSRVGRWRRPRLGHGHGLGQHQSRPNDSDQRELYWELCSGAMLECRRALG